MIDIEELLATASDFDRGRAKVAWRLFREFRDVTDLDEYEAPDRSIQSKWQVEQQVGSSAEQAIKLRLRPRSASAANHRCETVVLFPVHPANARHSDANATDQTASSRSRRLPRATACVSTQPGCGVGCPFCWTSQLGYRGNFSAVEIAEQVYWSGKIAKEHGFRLRNVVFMGMGEPLHNPKAVLQSLHLLTHPRLFGLQPRHITVSTAGVPGRMIELARSFPQVRIALSLHSAIPEQRRQLVPRATADLHALQAAIAKVNQVQAPAPVWLEVVLFQGINDSPNHAEALLSFSRGLRVEVNLIPYNPAANQSRFRAADRDTRERFARQLREVGLRTTIRTSFGKSNQAACGQLTTVDQVG